MSLKQVRLSSQAKDQLIRLKTKTGVQQWNVLCRWALCLSLRQANPPTPSEMAADGNIEMTWQVFGGEAQEVYLSAAQRALPPGWTRHVRRRNSHPTPSAPASRHRLPGFASDDSQRHRSDSPTYGRTTRRLVLKGRQ